MRGGPRSGSRRASPTSSRCGPDDDPKRSRSSRTTTRCPRGQGRPMTRLAWACRSRPRGCWPLAPDRNWTLMILVTDGEEAGLMGAAALVTDREVTSRLQAYINLEAIGSAGPPMLFETGPGNGWLVGPWARHASEPAWRIVRDRDLPAPAERHGFLHSEAPGHSRTELRGDRRQLRVSHDARHARAAVAADRAAHGRAGRRDHDGARRRRRHPAFEHGSDVLRYRRHVCALLRSGRRLGTRPGSAARRHRRVGARRRRGHQARRRAALAPHVSLDAGRVGRRRRLDGRRDVGAARGARGLSPLVRADRADCSCSSSQLASTVGWSIARLGQWLPKRAHGLRHPLVAWSLALPVWVVLAAAMVSSRTRCRLSVAAASARCRAALLDPPAVERRRGSRGVRRRLSDHRDALASQHGRSAAVHRDDLRAAADRDAGLRLCGRHGGGWRHARAAARGSDRQDRSRSAFRSWRRRPASWPWP